MINKSIHESYSKEENRSEISDTQRSKDSRSSELSPQNRRGRKYTSVMKNKIELQEYMSLSPTNYKSIIHQNPESIKHRQTYSPSPQRKGLYWQNWLLPSSFNLTQSCIELAPSTTSTAHCCMLTGENEILHSSKDDEVFEVASLTKIMTAYTVIYISHLYRIKLKEHLIYINKNASWMEGTSAGLREG